MKYRKKSVEIRAIPYIGRNAAEIKAFAGDAAQEINGELNIMSPEGGRALKIGDYVVNGVNGEFYASSPESFVRNHEHVHGNTYRKAGNIVDAIQFTGGNFPDIVSFTAFDPERTARDYDPTTGTCVIPHPTREAYECREGDYVVRNSGSVYPCKPDVFAQTYEVVGVEIPRIQRSNRLNRVYALDEPGPGGARHVYRVERDGVPLAEIHFQRGPRKDPNAVPGVTEADFYDILNDRLTAFQSGDFKCQANVDALNHTVAAASALAERARDRAERGVLGEDKA